MEEKKELSAIGQDILYTVRNELYMHLPYLDVALCGLEFAPGDHLTTSLATNGEMLYYSGTGRISMGFCTVCCGTLPRNRES